MDLLAHLEAYIAVAEENSFSGGADLLGIAQPVLSRRIKVLERHLGGELFDRSRRQITTTDLGVLLFPYAKDVLARVDQLRQLASTARTPMAYPLGVPPDCDPSALAGLIRVGEKRGVAIGVHELPAAERANGLADGSLAYALLRVPPETGSQVVPLGLASVSLPGVSDRRPVHLESLRPRRGAGRGPSPTILTTAEDQIGFAAERFRKAAARSGLPEASIRGVASTATAVAETLAGHAVLLCAEPLARRHDLAWSPLADAALHRGYELATARPGDRTMPVPGWLEPLLADVIGAAGDRDERPAVDGRGAEGADPRARLAARG